MLRMMGTAIAYWALCVKIAGVVASSGADSRAQRFTLGKAKADSLESEPNPPKWPASVQVFGPDDARNLTEYIANLTSDLNNRTTGHFSDRRVALLFKPGTYNVSIHVGYYVQVLGLGERASDVIFTGDRGVHCLAMDQKPAPGSLDTFWRGAENFRNEATMGMSWAVSQAAPLRRVHVKGDLRVYDEDAYASGGFAADIKVGGKFELGGQQQWVTRNAALSSSGAEGGIWNVVFVGSTQAPSTVWQNGTETGQAMTNVAAAPVVAEKPFITIDGDGKYWLQVPSVKRRYVGPSSHLGLKEAGIKSVPFADVFMAESKDTAATIQAKLDQCRNVVLTPGIYQLDHTLVLKTSGQVLLGIGMATLMAPLDGSPCIRVSSGVGDVRVAGVMLGASLITSAAKATNVSTLLEWGKHDTPDAGSPSEPGVLSDIFARVGGPDFNRSVNVDVMMRIHSGNVIGDNIWLWRADHSILGDDDPPPEKRRPEGQEYHLTELGEYPCKVGLEVFGADVTMYGLFVEHVVEDLTRWHGEGGQVYFYQSEFPYDVTQESYCSKNYSGYVIDAGVQSHEAWGIGVYSYFRDHTCMVESAIRAPETDGVRFTNIFTRYLNGNPGIRHVLNDRGETVSNSNSSMGRMPSSMSLPPPQTCPEPTASVKIVSPAAPIILSVILAVLLVLTIAYAGILKRSQGAQDPERDVQLVPGSR